MNDHEPKGGEHFEASKDAEKLAAVKEKITAPVTMAKGADGKEYMVTLADIEFKKIRNATTTLLKILDPEAHAKYRAMKESGTLADKRAAYAFAFNRMQVLAYTVSGL